MEKLALAADPVQLFYHGEMADVIVKEIQKNGKWFFKYILMVFLNIFLGGLITKEDLANYKPKVYEKPLTSDGFFGNLRMCGPPPPSSFAVMQSIVAVMVCRF